MDGVFRWADRAASRTGKAAPRHFKRVIGTSEIWRSIPASPRSSPANPKNPVQWTVSIPNLFLKVTFYLK